MSKLEEPFIGLSHRTSEKTGSFSHQESTLRSEVEKALHQYSIMLGLNRGTLRTKLKNYGLL